MKPPTRSAEQGGYILVLLAASMLAILTMVAFAVDLGSWFLQGSRLQRTSDAAALAGSGALPNIERAAGLVEATYERNGYTNGVAGIEITNDITSDDVKTSITDKEVPTHFFSFLASTISIHKESKAVRPHTAPSLGSPYNVLGSGNLDIPGIPRQNFWLAVNGQCTPKEDGDYFTAKFDGNKWPLSTTTDANNNFIPLATARHHCPNTSSEADWNLVEHNAAHIESGYSYYVDVPPPPMIGGTVTIRIYDGTYKRNALPDSNNSLPADYKENYVHTAFHVWDTKGTLDDETDDVLLRPWMYTENDSNSANKWTDLYTLPYTLIQKGGHFRVQVVPRSTASPNILYHRGVNAFAIGAFRSWDPNGCDTRTSPDCPQVYGRYAVSVHNNLTGGPGTTASFFLASIDTSYIGKKFYVFLWDPGEGVQKMQLIGPDGSPLSFNWTTDPICSGCSGTGVTAIDTSGTGPSPGPNRSNNFKFNDRLLRLEVTLPPEYTDMVGGPGGSGWLQLRYTLGTTANDRTTWGISMGADTVASGPPRLVQ